MGKIKTVDTLQKEYGKLEQAYDRLELVNQQQESLIKDLRREQRDSEQSQSQAIKESLRDERKKQARKADHLKEMASATGKAASLASGMMIGYYLLAEELDLWVVSEDFSRSEWFQALCTAALSWLLVQSYRMAYRM